MTFVHCAVITLTSAPGSIALGFTPGLTTEVLRGKSASVFKSSNGANPIRRAYVYGTLRNLCAEYSGLHTDKVFAARCKELQAHFSVQLGHAVNDLKLIIPATAEAASALTMAVSLSNAAPNSSREAADCLTSRVRQWRFAGRSSRNV